MYYALAQNNDQNWKVIFYFDYHDPARVTLLEESLDNNNNEILGMKVLNNLWDATKIGAEFDGESFTGGIENPIAPLPDDIEFWNNVNSYVFLHDNKVIAGIVTHKETSQETFIEEAFSGKVRLFKSPKEQRLQIGDVVSWNGEEFTAV